MKFLPSHERPTHCALQTCQHIQGTHNCQSIISIELDDDEIFLSEMSFLRKPGKDENIMMVYWSYYLTILFKLHLLQSFLLVPVVPCIINISWKSGWRLKCVSVKEKHLQQKEQL